MVTKNDFLNTLKKAGTSLLSAVDPTGITKGVQLASSLKQKQTTPITPVEKPPMSVLPKKSQITPISSTINPSATTPKSSPAKDQYASMLKSIYSTPQVSPITTPTSPISPVTPTSTVNSIQTPQAPAITTTGRDTAFQNYLNTLKQSSAEKEAKQKEAEARTKYLDFISSAESGIAGLEGQGRGIPLGLVRGQQEKLGQQSEITARRLQGDVDLAGDAFASAQAEREGLSTAEKARFDYEQALVEEERGAESSALEQAREDEKFALEKQKLEREIGKPLVVGEGQTLIDPETGEVLFKSPKTYAPSSTSSSGGGLNVSTGGGTSSTSALARIAQEIAPTNSKFANEQFKANAQYYIDSGDDVGLSNLIRKEAVNQLPSADVKAKYLNNITLIENLNRLEQTMSAIEAEGFDTNLFTGTKQSITNKIGKLGNPKLVDLAQQALNIRDLLTRARTGAALTESEERLYKKMVPSIFRTEELNSQIAKNLRESLQQSIDSATGLSLSKQQQQVLSGNNQGGGDEYSAYLKAIGQ